MATWQYYLLGEAFESSGLGDGSGWMEDVCDWVSVEAPNWIEARRLGRAKVQEEYPKGLVYSNRRDGCYPFTGEHCKMLTLDEISSLC